MRTCARRICENSLAGMKPQAKYCSRRCKERALQARKDKRPEQRAKRNERRRRRYAEDPEYRARMLQQSRENVRRWYYRNKAIRDSLKAATATMVTPPRADLLECHAEDCTNTWLSSESTRKKWCSQRCCGRQGKRDNPLMRGSKESQQAHRSKRRAWYAEGDLTTAEWKAQLASQEGLCYWCGASLGEEFDLEHVVPRMYGGRHTASNVVAACIPCNRGPGGKHQKHPLVWIAQLIREEPWHVEPVP